LFRPVILLPRVLAEQLPPHQLRAVLLHELVHLRRGDLWLSFAQALLQIVYWWHPLLWAANARIRRAREEAVDDAVMLALEDQAEAYAPTLVQVARLALARPPVSLGLVGILESGSFLRQRVERLLDFHPPRKAGLTLASVFSVAAFAALALPMGQAPAPAPKPEPSAAEAASAAPATSSAPATAAEEHRSSRSEVLLQDGKLLYQMGKLDEAEAKLEEARGLDPLTHGDRLDPLTHGDRMTLIQTLEAEGITLERYFRRVQAVDYYLKLIREARSKEALKKGDNAGTAPPQVSIQAVFIELPRAEVESFWEKFGSANGPASGGNARAATLTHAQAAAQLDRWKSMGGKNILGQFRVTTLSGRQAQVSLGDWETTMTNVGQGQAKPELIPHALEITPRTTDDDPGVKMDLNATLWEFLGYAASPQTVTVIGEQAMRLERELKTHQERLQNFLLSNNVVRLQEQGSSAGAEAAKRSKELASLRTEVKLLEVFTPEQLAQTIGRSRTGSDDGFSPFSQGIADDLSSHLVGPLADLFRASQQTRLLRAKREEVAEFLMPSHPKILKLDRYIAEQEAIVEVVKRQSLAYIADTRAALARQITNLESSVGEWEQKAVDASRKMAEYERLKQDVKRAQDLYGRLLRLVQNLDAGNSPIANGTNAVPVTATSSLPHFRVLHAAAAVEVQDGQTVVLGDLAGEDVSKLKDQVPVLKDLLILVTPTLVDPAGNRIHPQSK
ncbi:MAG TPA: M56 family metallopeptidase, partial [Dongiaceae bacterium]|nr:M56 family metallopeptidase [Dongiaceae bacterium]